MMPAHWKTRRALKGDWDSVDEFSDGLRGPLARWLSAMEGPSSDGAKRRRRTPPSSPSPILDCVTREGWGALVGWMEFSRDSVMSSRMPISDYTRLHLSRVWAGRDLCLLSSWTYLFFYAIEEKLRSAGQKTKSKTRSQWPREIPRYP